MPKKVLLDLAIEVSRARATRLLNDIIALAEKAGGQVGGGWTADSAARAPKARRRAKSDSAARPNARRKARARGQ